MNMVIISSVPRLLLSIVMLFSAATPVAAQRQRLSMDPGWSFFPGDSKGAEQPRFDDRRWRGLDLPHDWSIEGTPREDAPGGGRVGFFPSGIGWYRKSFRLPGGTQGKVVWLEFDGVYMNSDVWINGVHL
jgi:beta-galactosidase